MISLDNTWMKQYCAATVRSDAVITGDGRMKAKENSETDFGSQWRADRINMMKSTSHRVEVRISVDVRLYEQGPAELI
jgi:IS5 family transposase